MNPQTMTKRRTQLKTTVMGMVTLGKTSVACIVDVVVDAISRLIRPGFHQLLGKEEKVTNDDSPGLLRFWSELGLA
ncbi:hypothetical protein DY000_02029451 [Brassica cretica]|uniref:Uncharacterized protein n=1 Tax=Brassica cretica TaxID=69181 RepID=A0ABQ7DSV5_BRACR|nr:hypothetical protein DY000_02029451 [Brassica cretica]